MGTIKVCVFCESWESGGIESFLYNILSTISLKDLEIDIVVSQLKRGVFFEKTKALGVNFFELSGSQRKLFENYRLFSRLLKKRKYDVIHLNVFHALSFVYGFIAKKIGVKTRIVHSHNTALRKTPTRCLKLILHKLCKNLFYRCFTDFWACSSLAAGFMFPPKIVDNNDYLFIPNGIDIDKFAFSEEKRQSFRTKLGVNNDFLIVNIGRLCEQKNQTFLIDVAGCLSNKKVNFKLLLIGGGDKSEELRLKADKQGISDKVIFFGASDDIPSVLSAADVFALPSLFEGLGIVVIEAQAAGLPVVCSENIPKEAFVTDLITQVSLSKGAEGWADALAAKSDCDGRADSAAEIKNRGYDIKSTAVKIEKSYRGLK